MKSQTNDNYELGRKAAEAAKNDVRKVLEEAAALEDKNSAASKPKPKITVKSLPPAQ